MLDKLISPDCKSASPALQCIPSVDYNPRGILERTIMFPFQKQGDLTKALDNYETVITVDLWLISSKSPEE